MTGDKRSVEEILSGFIMVQTKFIMVNYINSMVAANAVKDEALIQRYAVLLKELLTFAINTGMLDERELDEAVKVASVIN